MERAAALEEFVQRVKGLRSRAALDSAAVEALDAFDAAGIEYMLLKGPALARLLYRREEHRAYSDVDVIVAPRDLPAARRVLEGLGYMDASAQHGIEDVAGVVHAEIWAQANQRIGPLMIDLHRRLAGVRAQPEAAWDVLAATRAWVDLAGRRVPVLGPDALALHLATHAAQHGPLDGKTLADLSRGLVRWTPDVWRSAARLATALEATDAFGAGLRLLPAGADMAAELDLPAAGEVDWEIRHRAARPRGTFHVQALERADSMRERAAVLRRALFPTREWLAYEHPWSARGRASLVAARVLHLLRAPVWAGRAWQFRRRARRASD